MIHQNEISDTGDVGAVVIGFTKVVSVVALWQLVSRQATAVVVALDGTTTLKLNGQPVVQLHSLGFAQFQSFHNSLTFCS